MQLSYRMVLASDSGLERHRSYFASFILAYAGVEDSRLHEAFAQTPRERFAGPGPWMIYTPAGWLESPTDNPAFLYQDVTVALTADGDLPSGRPSVHATFLAALGLRDGESVVHVGCGAGYYSAILGRLVGPSGSVLALEIVEELALRAANNLRDSRNVAVLHRSGAEGPIPACDVIYVNAGATGIPAAWLDAVRIGGRLLLPLTPREGQGGMLLLTRVSADAYRARFIYQVTFVPCIGARDEAAAVRLGDAFRAGDMASVRSLHRTAPPDGSAWYQGEGWWLSRREL